MLLMLQAALQYTVVVIVMLLKNSPIAGYLKKLATFWFSEAFLIKDINVLM